MNVENTTPDGSGSGSGSQDVGISRARLGGDLEDVRSAIHRILGAQQARALYLEDARRQDIVIDDGGHLENATAGANAAAAEDLDELLGILQRALEGAPHTERHESTSRPRATLDDWADAGYTSPAAVAKWASIGIDTPAVARQWVDGGFTAETAARWVGVPDMTPGDAASCAAVGMAPIDVHRIRRTDPGWARRDEPVEAPSPSGGLSM